MTTIYEDAISDLVNETMLEIETQALKELGYPDNYFYTDGDLTELEVKIGKNGQGCTDQERADFLSLVNKKLKEKGLI